MPTRHEERAIAQRNKNADIAKKNMRYLFGRDVDLVSTTSRVVRSAQNLDADAELNTSIEMKVYYRGGAKFESGVNAEGWRQDGSHWPSRQPQSGPGVNMNMQEAGGEKETKAE